MVAPVMVISSLTTTSAEPEMVNVLSALELFVKFSTVNFVPDIVNAPAVIDIVVIFAVAAEISSKPASVCDKVPSNVTLPLVLSPTIFAVAPELTLRLTAGESSRELLIVPIVVVPAEIVMLPLPLAANEPIVASLDEIVIVLVLSLTNESILALALEIVRDTLSPAILLVKLPMYRSAELIVRVPYPDEMTMSFIFAVLAAKSRV